MVDNFTVIFIHPAVKDIKDSNDINTIQLIRGIRLIGLIVSALYYTIKHTTIKVHFRVNPPSRITGTCFVLTSRHF